MAGQLACFRWVIVGALAVCCALSRTPSAAEAGETATTAAPVTAEALAAAIERLQAEPGALAAAIESLEHRLEASSAQARRAGIRAERLQQLLTALKSVGERAPPQRLPRATGAVTAGEGPLSPDALEFFETRVRPVLAERCYACHGPGRQTLGIRLDSRRAMIAGGETGPVLVPGDPAQSPLAQAIRYDGPVKMPPDGPLSEEECQAIEHWISLGAPWPGDGSGSFETMDEFIERARRTHWAFQPVTRPTPPAVSQPAAVNNPIDLFVQARLEAAGLEPSPKAGKRTLLRRVTVGLTGLLPTPEETAAFLADDSPEAFDKVIDRLLASPHYGERWARHWLDLARYADTKGYIFQEERAFPFSHTYRDYVIDAFNSDLPYDQFLMHQLAADLMDLEGNREPLAAMGFLTLGRRFTGNFHDIVDDRIDVVTRSTMALTVSCARCHDHKYDPIPTADYYSLYGVFASTYEPEELPLIRVPDPAAPQYQAFQAELAENEEALRAYLDSLHVDLLNHAREEVSAYLDAAREAWDAAETAELQTIARDRNLRWQLVQRWRDHLKRRAADGDPVFGPLDALTKLLPDEFPEAAAALVSGLAQSTADGPPANPVVVAALSDPVPEALEEVFARYGALFEEIEQDWTRLLTARAQIAAQDAGVTLPEALPDPHREQLRQALYGPGSPANVPASDLEAFVDISTRDRITRLRNAVARVKATHAGRPDRAMALYDTPEPHDPRVFVRGRPETPGDPVPRRFLAVLEGEGRRPFETGSGRLELAQAIASRSNPLTARVFVNRVWMHHFGGPLVSTTSDFGLRSEPPPHPELLDYLAWEFMESGWSTKHLQRLILRSHTYQQAAAARTDALSVDPGNSLLWRQNRRRLDFEAMRDTMLQAAGMLDLQMGGPAVDIVEPPFSARRTVYGFIERQNLPGMFRTFDFASPDQHSPRRYQTTVPQQALFLMNSPFVADQARRLADRAAPAQNDDPLAGISALYQLLFQRTPNADETELATGFLRQAAAQTPQHMATSPPVWSYGYGEANLDAGETVSFTEFAHFTGERWQAGPAFPDSDLAYASLNALGGHPGNTPNHAVVRRWTSPVDAMLAMEGHLRHDTPRGDGVQGFVISSREGVLWSGQVHNGELETNVAEFRVKPGDTIDLVVACGETPHYDSFNWHPRIWVKSGQRDGQGAREWLSRIDFAGPVPPPPPPLAPWEQYAQALLLTNEFAFLD